MSKIYLLLFFIGFVSDTQAQDSLVFFSHSFEPVKNEKGAYTGIARHVGNKWMVEALDPFQKTYAVKGWYLDRELKIKDSTFLWYHPDRSIKKIEHYRNNKLEGIMTSYYQSGILKDSIHYNDGKKIGVGYTWSENGYLLDSTYFDGKGNGIQISWYPGDEGGLKSTGYWKNDTSKINTWSYFFENGKLWAKENYRDTGRVSCQCYDLSGAELDSIKCTTKKECEFIGGTTGWSRFLRTNLNPMVGSEGLTSNLTATVMAAFIVDENGNLSEIKTETNYGRGMEEEVIRVLKKSPKWAPAYIFGRPVKSQRKQPVTFVHQVQ